MSYINVESFYNVDYSDIIIPIITIYKKSLWQMKTNIKLDFDTGVYIALLFGTRDGIPIMYNVYMIKDTLEEIEENIPLRFTPIGRCDDDDKSIVKTYI